MILNPWINVAYKPSKTTVIWIPLLSLCYGRFPSLQFYDGHFEIEDFHFEKPKELNFVFYLIFAFPFLNRTFGITQVRLYTVRTLPIKTNLDL